MERIHPEDDLLQRAGRHHPHEDAIHLVERDALAFDDRPAGVHVGPDAREMDRAQIDVERSRRAQQVGHMPSEARNEGGDLH